MRQVHALKALWPCMLISSLCPSYHRVHFHVLLVAPAFQHGLFFFWVYVGSDNRDLWRDNEGPVSTVWKQGGAERQLSQPRSHGRPECRPLLKFVKSCGATRPCNAHYPGPSNGLDTGALCTIFVLVFVCCFGGFRPVGAFHVSFGFSPNKD